MRAVICHDSGGAEILSSWVRKNQHLETCLVLDGPAVEIFKKKGLENINTKENLEKCINQVDFVLTGTSWASDLEKRAIKHAKKKGIMVASFIDHWVNYPQRFEFNEAMLLPNEIWVGDKYAFQLAQKYFPTNILRLVNNPYFEDIKAEQLKIDICADSNEGVRILYVTEPIQEHATKKYGNPMHWGYTEFTAIKYFLETINDYVLSRNKSLNEIRIRSHPSETKDKYQDTIEHFHNLPVKISQQNSLLYDCNWADWVCGCETMAMVVGLYLEKEVYTTIPKGGRACSLPHSEIINYMKFATQYHDHI